MRRCETLTTILRVSDDQLGVRQPWDEIDLALSAEVARLAEHNVITESETQDLWATFRSVEAQVTDRLQAAGTGGEPSPADRLRAGLRARMWLATAIEAGGTKHERAVAIRQRIVELEKSLGIFEKPTLVQRRQPES